MPKKWTVEELQQEVEKWAVGRRWYHKIDLGGVVTPGYDFDSLWDNIRHARSHLNYRGKKVLDLGSWDGMWAFEAEKLGAELVVATDCFYYQIYQRFLFCREVLGSKVIPYYNVSVYDLWNRLDVFLRENWDLQKPYDRLFDVVQHMGILYHLRDPMLTLSQARSVLRTGGHLLMETAYVVGEEDSFMLFNGVPPDESRIYADLTTWWAPTLPCLKDMLRASLFEPLEQTISLLPPATPAPRWAEASHRGSRGQRFTISRVSLVARALAAEEMDKDYYRELSRTYRNPGLVVEHLSRS